MMSLMNQLLHYRNLVSLPKDILIMAELLLYAPASHTAESSVPSEKFQRLLSEVC